MLDKINQLKKQLDDLMGKERRTRKKYWISVESWMYLS